MVQIVKTDEDIRRSLWVGRPCLNQQCLVPGALAPTLVLESVVSEDKVTAKSMLQILGGNTKPPSAVLGSYR